MNSLRRKGLAAGTLALDNLAVFLPTPVSVSTHEGSRSGANPGETELVEIGLTRVLLGQAERQMDSLKSRIGYLERRAGSSIGATARELEDLMWARDELAISSARVAQLSSRLERPSRDGSDGYLEWDGWNE